MTDEQTNLRRVPAREPDRDIVDTLESLLEDAKQGRIVSIAFCAELTGRRTGSFYQLAKDGSYFQLLGALSNLQCRINQKIEGG